MNIVVLLKQVPDTESVIEISDTQKSIETEEIKWVINPYDDYSIEEALLIKESVENARIIALTAGSSRSDEALKIAYALGVDEGIRIDTTDVPEMDAFGIATILSAALEKIQYDLIFAGQRAVDNDNYLVPTFVAEQLDLPLVTNIIKQEIQDEKIKCDQVIDGGVAIVEAELPAVVTSQKGLNEPRYPNMRAIMKARKKQVTVFSLADIGISSDDYGPENNKVKTVSFLYPPVRKQGRLIEGATPAEKATELIKLLKEETDVL